jgi:hypothetical protein
MDYASLTIQIQNYANRSDDFFIAQIPNFITQGITRIYSEARSIGFQKIQDGNPVFAINTATITKPNDWKETISLSYTVPGAIPLTKYVLPRTYEFCKTYWPNDANTGDPVFYADYSLPQATVGAGQFFLVPTPAGAYQYQLTYLSTPIFTANAGSNQNFLTDRYPSLLLYACLLETIPFLKDDERIAVFETLYNRALKDINKDTTDRYTDRLSKRDKD